MNKRTERYCRLHNAKQLGQERKKLRSRIRVKEMELQQDAEILVERFSPANLLNEAKDRLLCSSGLLQNVMAGIQTVRMLFGGRRARGRYED